MARGGRRCDRRPRGSRHSTRKASRPHSFGRAAHPPRAPARSLRRETRRGHHHGSCPARRHAHHPNRAKRRPLKLPLPRHGPAGTRAHCEGPVHDPAPGTQGRGAHLPVSDAACQGHLDGDHHGARQGRGGGAGGSDGAGAVVNSGVKLPRSWRGIGASFRTPSPPSRRCPPQRRKPKPMPVPTPVGSSASLIFGLPTTASTPL